jgi:hypothetical protein
VTGLLATGRRARDLWLAAWPVWAVLLFALLAATRLLPGGPARAVLATPILLTVPGALTLGAVFGRRRRPEGVAFASYTVLLSVIWTVFAALALYVVHILITAVHLYWCLLVISVLLAAAAGARLVLDWQGSGRRVAARPEEADPDLSGAEVLAAEEPPTRAGALHVALAAVVGVGLLGGAVYAYEHHRGPAPPGYTWLAWTGPRTAGDIALPSHGAQLPFEIVHHQGRATSFRLTATWLGSPSRTLAPPVTFTVGPDQTYHGSLTVPALPDRCTYRLQLVLTAGHQIDPLTQATPTWTINADVYQPGQAPRSCTS